MLSYAVLVPAFVKPREWDSSAAEHCDGPTSEPIFPLLSCSVWILRRSLLGKQELERGGGPEAASLYSRHSRLPLPEPDQSHLCTLSRDILPRRRPLEVSPMAFGS